MDAILLVPGLTFCAIVLIMVGYIIHAALSKIDDLETKNENLEKRVTALEGRKSRNPMLTDVGLEDTNAVLMDVQQTLDYLDARTQQARSIIAQIRSNHSKYDENMPNGKKAR